MTITIDGGAGITFPDTVQQTNATTNTGGAPRYYAARAWVNFDGNGTASIRAASNVASVTYINTGRYRINFATPMPDTNYVTVATAGVSSSASSYYNVRTYGTPSTSSVSIMVTAQSSGSPTYFDAEYMNLVVFR